MKTKIGFILLLFISILTTQIARATDSTPTTPVTITDEIFTVPGPKDVDGVIQNPGIERPFALTDQSTVDLTVLSNKQKPALNVYLLDADTYGKYKTSGSLTNLTPIDNFSKKQTLGFQTSGVLPSGKYVFIIKWAKSGLFTKAPAVGFKLISQVQSSN